MNRLEKRQEAAIKFINKAKSLHGNCFDYSEAIYLTKNTKLKINCKKHGSFYMTPGNHLRSKKGCSRCHYDSRRLSNTEFICKAREVHGDKYNYSQVVYTSIHEKIKIICPNHGVFSQKAGHHLQGSRCYKCANHDMDTSKFIQRAKSVHGEAYDYSLSIYSGWHNKLIIICKTHGIFKQRASSHINGNGCLLCNDFCNSVSITKIESWLINNNVHFIREKTFKDLKGVCRKNYLRFDFFLTVN